MMKNVCMKDCNFAINKEKRTIVCWLNGTENFFNEFLCENYGNFQWYLDFSKYKMNNRFTGTAYCSEEDEWDEEIGKRLAFYRMKRKLLDSFYNKVRAFFDDEEEMLDNFEDVCLAYKTKVESSMARQMNKIVNLGGIDGYKED